MHTLRALITKLIQPSPAITNSVDRHRAYMLSTLLAGMMILLLVMSAAWFFFSDTVTTRTAPVIITGNALIIVSYWLSRTRWYRTAAWLLTIGIVLTSFIGYSLDLYSAPERGLMYLVIIVMMASLVLSRLETLIILTVIEALLIIVPLAHPNPDYNIWNVPFFVASVGVLTLIWVSINENYRRQVMQGEQRYRDLMNANNEAIVVVDYDDGRILDFNPAFSRITGYPPEEIIGRFPSEFLTDESASVVDRYWKQRDSTPHEVKGIRKDGKAFFIRSTLKPYTFRNEPAYVLTIQDITKQRAAETALRMSERRFEAIFHNTFQFIYVLDHQGNIEGVNAPMLQRANVNLAAVLGIPLWQAPWWKDNDARQLIREKLQHATRGEFVRFEVDIQPQDGALINVDLSIKPISDDVQVAMLIAEARDITDRKNEERIRHEYQHRYHALFNNTADAVFISDIKTGKLIGANQQALTMLRCTMEDILNASTFEFIVEDEIPQSQQYFEQLRAGEEIPAVYERSMRRKDGEVFVAEVTAMMVLDGDGDPLYIQSMVRDTTERRQAQQRQFELALHRERASMLENFITQASHHFRTPITNIKTSIFLLPRLKGNEEKQEKYYGILFSELERLQNLLDDLLMVARLQKEEEQYYISHILMDQLMSEMRTGIESRADHAKFTWQWEMQLGYDVVIVGDKQRLSRALINIFDNAMNYTPEGGTIKVRSYQHNSWAVVEVEDSGIGIRSEDLSYIFDDFFRSADALEMDSKSSGLGLSITKQIIERHKGTIHVSSEHQNGTLVQVLLPILLDWHSPPPPPAEIGQTSNETDSRPS